MAAHSLAIGGSYLRHKLQNTSSSLIQAYSVTSFTPLELAIIEIHRIISVAQIVGGLKDDVHGNERAKAADQHTNQIPDQNIAAIFGNHYAITGSSSVHTILDLIQPVNGVQATGKEGEEDVLAQATNSLSVLCTHLINILCQLIDNVVAVNTTGKDAEQNVSEQRMVGLHRGSVDVGTIRIAIVAACSCRISSGGIARLGRLITLIALITGLVHRGLLRLLSIRILGGSRRTHRCAAESTECCTISNISAAISTILQCVSLSS